VVDELIAHHQSVGLMRARALPDLPSPHHNCNHISNPEGPSRSEAIDRPRRKSTMSWICSPIWGVKVIRLCRGCGWRGAWLIPLRRCGQGLQGSIGLRADDPRIGGSANGPGLRHHQYAGTSRFWAGCGYHNGISRFRSTIRCDGRDSASDQRGECSARRCPRQCRRVVTVVDALVAGLQTLLTSACTVQIR
jgi:hypothetical protein